MHPDNCWQHSPVESSRWHRWLLLMSTFLLLAALPVSWYLRPMFSAASSQKTWEKLQARIASDYRDVPQVTVNEYLASQHVLLVDVRADNERSVSYIPGSISVESFSLNSPASKHQLVVAYCTVGVRSSQWAREQRALGLDACNLQGGITAWCRHGLPLNNASGPTTSVHIYGPRWNYLPATYRAEW